MIANRLKFHRDRPSSNAPTRPKIGLALSGGGARGSAHMGVLRTLEQAGMAYDLMSATSIGALAGLMHCSGYSADYMIDACKRELMPSWWLSRVPGGAYLHLMRLLKPGGIAKKLRRYVGDDCRLEELPTPLLVTATDLVSGEIVVQDRGCAITALMASMSLPGMATPVDGGNRLLVDGGVLNNLPGDVLRARGADIVIGVDISGQPVRADTWQRCGGTFSTLSRSWQLMTRQRNAQEQASCDIVIRPHVSDVSFTAFAQVDRLADAGSAATEAVLPQIRRLIDMHTRQANTLRRESVAAIA